MGPGHQVFAAFACIVVYGGFLWLQTSRYRSFFEEQSDGGPRSSGQGGAESGMDRVKRRRGPRETLTKAARFCLTRCF